MAPDPRDAEVQGAGNAPSPFGMEEWEHQLRRSIDKHFRADHLRRTPTFAGYDSAPAAALADLVVSIASTEIDEWVSVVGDLVDHEPCRYDHDDNCQAHNLDHRPCPHERVKALALRPRRTDG